MPPAARHLATTVPGGPGSHARRSRGQAVVEFALILPVLMLLFAAILDLGRIAFAQVAITNAAREGAFQASVTPDSYSAGQPCPADGLSNLVICRTVLEARGSSVVIEPTSIDLQCTPTGCADGIGHTVAVRVTTKFQLLTPVLTLFFGGGRDITLTASSLAQIETLPTPTFSPPWAPPSPSPSASASPSASPPSNACVLPSAGFSRNQSHLRVAFSRLESDRVHVAARS